MTAMVLPRVSAASMVKLVVNLLAFQIAWFACVLGGANGQPWTGVLVAAAVVALHLRLSAAPGREALLVVLVGLIGAIWDGWLVRFGFLEYPSGMFLPWLAPVWIIAMWMAFATTLNGALGWLKGRWGLSMVFGAIGGPLAFYAGHRLGAVSFPDPVVALGVLGGGWSFLMPLLMWAAGRLESPGPTRTRAIGDPIEDTPGV